MSSLPDQSYCNPHAHSLRCRSCSVPLIMLPSISCCKTRVSLCDSCYTDNKCLNCITRDLSTGYTLDSNNAFAKISTIDNYNPGDIVLFHPVIERVGQFNNTHLNLVHINKPIPFVLLHNDSYAEFGRKKGTFCDLVIAKLTSRITQEDQQVSKELCQLLGDTNNNVVYTVQAEPVNAKFRQSSKSEQ